ncbi:RNA polymerase sigma factor [Candidatus Peregrinibacteria bacterium]|nr:RNA polymerase sigma factor [Candidatus Peregrinibacteria bacterium]
MPQKEEIEQFTVYYEEHKTSIFNYILYRVGFNHSTAEDLTSDIFLKAFEHFDSYDKTRPFKTWIFTIAHNHLVNYYAGKKEVLPLEEARELVKDIGSKETAERNITMQRILNLISGLPESQRDIVTMKYVNDLTNEEIARVTGKEEGTIRTALSRAIASLRGQYNIKFQEDTL